MGGYGGFERFILLGLLVIFYLLNYSSWHKGGGIGMLILMISVIGLLIIMLINLSFKHGVFLTHVKLDISLKGLNLEIKTKEKSNPSNQE